MSKKMEIGDVIVISYYITPDNVKMQQHSFVVLQTMPGKIAGIEIGLDLELEFDLVTAVMSSIKNKKHREKIQSFYPKDMIVEFNDAQIINGNKKDGFIKTNQLYYFKKEEISYMKIGRLNENTLDKLFELIEINGNNNELEYNYNNIIPKKETVE